MARVHSAVAAISKRRLLQFTAASGFATVLRPIPAGAVIAPEDHGAKGDGQSDDRPALQAAIDRASATRGVVQAREGAHYKIGSGLFMRDGTTLALGAAHIVRGFSGTSGFVGALIGQETVDRKISNVSVTGGIFQGNGMPGRVVSWYGDNWKLDGLHVAEWGHSADTTTPARAISWIGDNTTIRGVVTRNPVPTAGYAGIVMAGGSGALITGCDIESGDDCYAVAPNLAGQFAGQPVRGVKFLNNTGTSYAARLFAVGAVQGTPQVDITDVTVDALRGNSHGRMAIMLGNNAGVGNIAGIVLRNVSVRADPQRTLFGIFVHDVSQVEFDGCECSGARDALFRIVGPCSGVTARGCHFDGSESGIAVSAVGQDVRDVIFDNCTIQSGRMAAFLLQASPSVDGFSLTNSRISNISSVMPVVRGRAGRSNIQNNQTTGAGG